MDSRRRRTVRTSAHLTGRGRVDRGARGAGAPGARPGEPRQSASERARARTRGELLTSGRALFAERGLHGVTSHDIAARAGVAAGTFYNHFSDKAALFREVAAEAIRELERRLDAAHPPERGLRESVRPIAASLVDFAAEQGDLIRILFSREADAADVQADVLARLAARIEQSRRESIARGEMPAELDPAILAQAVVGMWARVLAWWAEQPSRAPRERVVETLAAIQLGGTHPAAVLPTENAAVLPAETAALPVPSHAPDHTRSS